MDEKRFERMENMLTDLIKITGNLNKEVQNLKKEMGDVKADLYGVKAEMKKGFDDIKREQIKTNQILAEMRADQDFIWEKAAKNEREIAKIKNHLQM
ncbi:hypothetical protein [Neobacillus terrae]|uniref:hypothetical protein n=1 Tax=Neobacillus terrae TaxID=3034837 RepID=UPI00140DD42A|nr:hypothetical protein [Neobacillus terrae]NHM31452.1 hypothetical protein [Neobacillus terrae]